MKELNKTEENFMETYDFIKECGINQLHVFPYSPREGTLAASMKDQVDPKTKELRVDKLIKLSNDLTFRFYKSNVGNEVKILVERFDSKKQKYFGHTSNYIEMYVDEGNIGIFVTTTYKKSDIIEIK